MAYPTEPVLDYSYTGFQQSQGDNAFPGTPLDSDLAALDLAVTECIQFLTETFNADGALKNGSVTYDSLDVSLQAILGDAGAVDALDELVQTATDAAEAAALSASAAGTAAADAAALYDSFDDRYLGSKPSDPTFDNDANPLLVGALYWNTTASALKVYNGATWVSYTGSSGITEVVQDPSPQLGGDLDLNGHVITGMVMGTDVQAHDPNTAKLNVTQTFINAQTFANTLRLQRAIEKVQINPVGDKPPAVYNFDALTATVHLFGAATLNNWTLNIRGDAANSFNSLLAAGEALTLAYVVLNGATAFFQNGFMIDGAAPSGGLTWMGAAAPTAGTVNKRDSYAITIFKYADASFIVHATYAKGF